MRYDGDDSVGADNGAAAAAAFDAETATLLPLLREKKEISKEKIVVNFISFEKRRQRTQIANATTYALLLLFCARVPDRSIATCFLSFCRPDVLPQWYTA